MTSEARPVAAAMCSAVLPGARQGGSSMGVRRPTGNSGVSSWAPAVTSSTTAGGAGRGGKEGGVGRRSTASLAGGGSRLAVAWLAGSRATAPLPHQTQRAAQHVRAPPPRLPAQPASPARRRAPTCGLRARQHGQVQGAEAGVGAGV